MLDGETRHRTPSERFRVHRAASAVVGPINRKISGWQGQAALLKARMQSTRLKSEDRAAARAEAGGLSHEIVQQVLELEHAVAELPPDIQSSTKIDDTFRAMQQVMQGLRQTLGGS